jgi:hypothetical protein
MRHGKRDVFGESSVSAHHTGFRAFCTHIVVTAFTKIAVTTADRTLTRNLIADLKIADVGPNFHNDAGPLMSGDHRQLTQSLFDIDHLIGVQLVIRSTQTDSLNLYNHFTLLRWFDRDLFVSCIAWSMNYNCFHLLTPFNLSSKYKGLCLKPFYKILNIIRSAQDTNLQINLTCFPGLQHGEATAFPCFNNPDVIGIRRFHGNSVFLLAEHAPLIADG